MGITGTSMGQVATARSAWPAVVLLAAALASLAFYTAPNIIGLFRDDGIYAVVAKARRMLREEFGRSLKNSAGDNPVNRLRY